MSPEDRHETLPERLIREAIEAGRFDNLPGEGRPLPGAGTADDELWWVREWLRRDRVGNNEVPGAPTDGSSPNRTDG